jgi:hypothetical protein
MAVGLWVENFGWRSVPAIATPAALVGLAAAFVIRRLLVPVGSSSAPPVRAAGGAGRDSAQPALPSTRRYFVDSRDATRADEGAAPSLAAALRRARIDQGEQNQAVVDLREAAITRLERLAEAVRPVIAQIPSEIVSFDVGMVYGERPRLFVDILGFVEVARDRRTYRFLQDTRAGRVLIAETEQLDRVVAAITNYIARRLVERERALASSPRSGPEGDWAVPIRARFSLRQSG